MYWTGCSTAKIRSKVHTLECDIKYYLETIPHLQRGCMCSWRLHCVPRHIIWSAVAVEQYEDGASYTNMSLQCYNYSLAIISIVTYFCFLGGFNVCSTKEKHVYICIRGKSPLLLLLLTKILQTFYFSTESSGGPVCVGICNQETSLRVCVHCAR